MKAYGFIDVLVDETNECPGCAMRWKAESPTREVKTVRHSPETGGSLLCEVTGWSSAGRCAATAVTIEDSGGGTAILVWGGDLGLRLTGAGGERFGEPYLLLAPEDVVA